MKKKVTLYSFSLSVFQCACFCVCVGAHLCLTHTNTHTHPYLLHKILRNEKWHDLHFQSEIKHADESRKNVLKAEKKTSQENNKKKKFLK